MNTSNEILFILDNLSDLQTLANENPNADVILLDSKSDALTQIADHLKNRNNLDAIHIFSHGSEGKVNLGNVTLSNENINDYVQTFSQIGSALSEQGDILLYGCNVAKGDDGFSLINMLAKLTKADVAASDDLTGASAKGGDWILENHTGTIENTPLSLSNWNNTLATRLVGFFFVSTDPNWPIDKAPWMTDGTAAGTVKLGYRSAPKVSEFTALGNSQVLFFMNAGALYVTDGTNNGTNSLASLSSMTNLTPLGNGKVLFQGGNSTNGKELFITDGTAAGTKLLKDIKTGTTGSEPTNITPLGNGKAIFVADDGVNGKELWITDGTEAETKLLKDIYVGTVASSPKNLMVLGNGKVLFSATDSSTNGEELWITDGTTAGTTLVKNIAGTGSSFPNGFTNLGNGKAIFSATDSTNGEELWITDGTTAGTTLVKNILTGTTGSTPTNFTALGNGKAFFSADDGIKGKELWITDGTTAGTALVKDIQTGTTGSTPTNFTALGNGKAIFSATDSTNGEELWITDGTTAGTTLLKDIRTGTGSSKPTNFSASGNGTVIFSADDGIHGKELWITDGTTAGTTLFKDANTTPNSSTPLGFAELGTTGKAVFSADDGVNGKELWVTDGTASGTKLLKDIYSGQDNSGTPNSSSPQNFTALKNGKILFSATNETNGIELWITDGTESGTTLLKDINSTLGKSSSPSEFTALQNGNVLFRADDGTVNAEPWVTDGTTSGTKLLKDIYPRNVSQATFHSEFSFSFTTLSTDKVLFAAVGDEIWITDGATQGTILVKDIIARNVADLTKPAFFTELKNGAVVFSGKGSNGQELWVTDGTANGTKELKDIAPTIGTIVFGSNPKNFVKTQNDKVLFVASDENKKASEWITDGTTAGTIKFATVMEGSPAPETFDNPISLKTGKVLFSGKQVTTGQELWITDGTKAGTQLVKDIRSGMGNSMPQFFTELPNGKVLFSASDSSGNELWITDGTESGTTQLKDIWVGISGSSNPSDFKVLSNGKVLFSANDGSGKELWITDGTADGTLRVKDINPTTKGSDPSKVAFFNLEAINAAPTLTSITNLKAGAGTSSMPISYADLQAAANEADAEGDAISFRIEKMIAGTLTKNGTPVTAGSTLISSGDSVVWTPKNGSQSLTDAFAVKAFDGNSLSATPVTVKVGLPSLSIAGYDVRFNSMKIKMTDGSVEGDIIDVSKLTIGWLENGSTSNTYTLTSNNVTVFHGSINITLNEVDQLHVKGILNKNGEQSPTLQQFNLLAAANWNMTRLSPADNSALISVYNVGRPIITNATYDALTGILSVTGTNFVHQVGENNDIDVTKLKIYGYNGGEYTLTSNTSNVEVISATKFDVTLGATDKTQVELLLDKNGESASSGQTYNLAVADDWNGLITGGDISDLTSNSISVSLGVQNQAPTFTGGANAGLTLLEDATATTISNVELKVVDAEQTATELVYKLITLPTKGALTLNNVAANINDTFTQADIDGGLIKFTPTPNENGADSFTFSVSDGAGGLITSQTFGISITSVNDLPTANNNTATVQEAIGYTETPVTGNLLSDDTDADNTLSVSAIRTGNVENSGTAGTIGNALAGTYGSLTLSADGSYSYAVDNTNATVDALKTGESLTESFNYTVTDGTATDTAVLAITIEGGNDSPTMSNLNGDATDFWLGSTTRIRLDNGQDMTLSDPDSTSYNGTTLSVALSSNLGTGNFTIDGSAFKSLNVSDGAVNESGFSGGEQDIAQGENVGFVTAVGKTRSTFDLLGIPIFTENYTEYTFHSIGTVATADAKGFSLTLNANATLAQVQSLIRNVYYLESLSDTTGAGARTFEIQLNEASSTLANSVTATLTEKIPVPTITLTSDTGSSASDFFTKSGAFSISGLLSNVTTTWQYSSDNGTTWFDGTGTTFTILGEGEKTVVARQLDIAKKTSENSTAIVVTLDNTSPTIPVLNLTNDTGSNALDRITKESEITVSNLETGASWQYDIGSGWVTGTGATIPASVLTGNGAKSISIQQTDKAGNISANSDAFRFTLDTTVATPTISFAENTGNTGDTITQNGTLNVAGLEAGANWQYSLDSGVTWAVGSGSSFTLTGDGAKSAIVQQTDLAGNISVNSSAFGFTLDTTIVSPTVTLSDSGSSASDNITKTGTVTLAGLETNATWQYSLDGGSVWANGTGTSYVFTGDGDKSITVRQTDVAANVSSNSATLKFTLDTTIATPTLALVSDTNLLDGITSNGKVTVANLESGAKWEYSIDNGTNWATGSGDNFTLSTDGVNQILVRQTDAAGNTATSNALTVTLDTNAVAPTLALANDTGKNGDKITSVSTLNISGIETGASWEYNLGSGWVNGTGTTIPSSDITGDGEKSIAVRQTDLAGNVSASSAAFTFVLNSTPATKPSLALAVDTATNTDNITSNGTVNVSGLENGATWQYSVDSGSNWLDGSGTSFTLKGDGAKSVVVKQTNVAGSVSASSDALVFTLDASVATPTIALTTDTGTSNSDRLTKDSNVTVSGLEANATWEYKIGTGNWTVGTGSNISNTAITGDGDKEVIVRQTDVAGNISSSSAALNFTLVTINDAASGVTLATDTGSSTTDGITNSKVVNVSGLDLAASWQYQINGGSWVNGGTITTGTSSFTLDNAEVDGKKSIVVHQTNSSGVQSADSTVFNFILDTTITAPTLSFTDTAINNDSITSNPIITVLGLEDGASWKYSLDNAVNWINGVGSSFTLSSDGDKSILVQQTDAAGNNAISNTPLAFKLDTTIVAPTLALTTDTGTSGDLVTKNGSVTISNLESGGTWRYSTDAGLNWSNWTAATTNTFELTGEGKKSVIVEQKDVAGNTSTQSTPLNFIIDTSVTAPTFAFTDTSNNAKITSNGKVTVSGLEDGATWQYSVSGGTNWTASSGDNVILTGDGEKVFTVKQTDLAGNESSASLPTTFTLDTTVAAPTLALINDTNVTTDKITSNGAVTVSGIETGGSWHYSVDGGNTWTLGGAVANDGTSSIPALTSEGANTIIVKQTDVAGNISRISPQFTFGLDTTVAMPTLALAQDTNINNDNITSNGKITISNLESGATWKYSLDNGTNWTTGSGDNFTLTEDGEKSVIVEQKDVAGNTATSSALTFTLDTKAISPSVSLAGDTGASITDGITSNQTVNVSNLETSATWEYSLNGTTWNAGTGSSFTFTDADGAKTISVRQKDVAGNQSDSSPTLSFTIDTVTTKPTLSFNDTGTVGDGLTKDGKVTVANLENGATWEYSNDGINWVIGSGNSVTLTEDGNKTIRIRATDTAGNTQTSDIVTFKLDATAATPVLSLANDTGRSDTDLVTSNGIVNVANLEDGTWEYSLDEGQTWTVGTNSSVTITEIGMSSIIVRQTDASANVSANSLPLTFWLEETPPIPVAQLSKISNVTIDNVILTNNGEISVSELVANATIQYSFDGINWLDSESASTVTLEGDGTKSISVRQIALSGLTSEKTEKLDFVLDTLVEKPTLSLKTDTGVDNADVITKDGTLIVSNLEAGSMWQYSLDFGQSWEMGDDPVLVLKNDEKKFVMVQQVDMAGNISEISDEFVYQLDTFAPQALNLTLIEDTGVRDNITRNGAIRVGNLEEGATWEYSVDSGITWTLGNGVDFVLTNAGDKTVIARQIDLAGNIGSISSPLRFTLESVPSNSNSGFSASASEISVTSMTLPSIGQVITKPVPKEIEMKVRSASGIAGDGNGDGISDAQQKNVVSLPTEKTIDKVQKVYVSIELPQNQTLTQANVIPFTEYKNITFKTEFVDNTGKKGVIETPISQDVAPFGLFEFKLEGVQPLVDKQGKTTGGTTEVKLYLDGEQTVEKYIKQTISGEWENIPFKAAYDEKLAKTVISISLTDGDKFDLDNKIDGNISDPGVPIIVPKLTAATEPVTVNVLPIPATKIFVGYDRTFNLDRGQAQIFGKGAVEVLNLGSNTNNVLIDQNVEQVNFSGLVSDFSFVQMGKVWQVAKGSVMIAHIVVQDDNNGTLMSFSNDEMYSVKQSANGTLGMIPYMLEYADMPQSLFQTTTVFTANNENVVLNSRLIDVYGSKGNDAIGLTANASGITFDQNVEQVNLPAKFADYNFLSEGNSLNIFSGTTLVANVGVQGDDDGTALNFSDGLHFANFTTQNSGTSFSIEITGVASVL